MVLTTGNKSEMSVGYATLYGDMCGGYNVLKDVYKTEVFKLSHWRNAHHPRGALGPKGRVIPERIITKPPSAELRENQKDQDSLPPYDILDGILECLVENEMTFEATCAKGYHPATVKRVEQLLYTSEYKRRQAPPGVKITAKNSGGIGDIRSRTHFGMRGMCKADLSLSPFKGERARVRGPRHARIAESTVQVAPPPHLGPLPRFAGARGRKP